MAVLVESGELKGGAAVVLPPPPEALPAVVGSSPPSAPSSGGPAVPAVDDGVGLPVLSSRT